MERLEEKRLFWRTEKADYKLTQKAETKIRREKQQFCDCIDAYKFNMFRLAKSILHNDSDAEDATGEAILKAYENLHSLRSFQSFKPWIMKIVLRQAYNLAGRRQRIVYMEDIEIGEITDAGTMAEDSRELWQVVHRLEEEFRLTTILFYYEDMKVKDIAKTLDLPVGTVKSRLARAREKLKGLLTAEGGRKDG